ncbi:MAG: Ferrous-iron efflux pump FieF [Alphaproteobacteria bacterium MarineAlpha3_Bin1]|nr:MAG: Ferrous-iron efflux pump FieF [Alphaproteobacteria bacterium MarineAlpha3_Bin1]
MSASSAKHVVIAALIGNSLIAVTKFGAAVYTGSSAMMSEGIHSLVDTTNQALLLYGIKRSARPADDMHPFGYGREIYFWAFVVAVLIFAVGAGVSIYEGVSKLAHPTPVENAFVNYIVLGLAFVFEACAWWVAFREFNRMKGTLSYFKAIRVSKDPAVTHLQMHDDICMECLMDLSELPGAEELIRELNPGPIAGPITIGDVVAAVENSWNGSLVDASVLPVPDPSLWTFEAPVYYGESMGETEKILLSRIVRGIVQGWELVVDPSTYTGTPGCLLWTDESIVNIVLPDEGTVGTPYSHTLDGIWVSPI